MKHLIKKYNKILLLAGVCLFSLDAFSASEATKRMIHDTLSKFCIPPEKKFCNPDQEAEYDTSLKLCFCNDGWGYNDDERICKECLKGTYYKKNRASNKCKSCSLGTYQDEIGKSSCKDCEAGSYASGTGNSSCTSCSPGTYSGSGASSCTDCPAGSYASGTGNSSCTSCSAGSYASGTGNSSCTSCSAGSYASGTGNSSCTSCSPGHYASGTGNTSCASCSPGKYASGYGNSGCSSCWAGSYQPNSGQSKCETCDANACYKVTNNRTSCDYKCGNYDICKNGSCIRCELDASNWEKIADYRRTKENNITGTLEVGVYKIVVTGGAGGCGGHAKCVGGYQSRISPGGAGDKQTYIIKLNSTKSFKVKKGNTGESGDSDSGACGVRKGKNGGRGGTTVFSINGIDYKAEGGYGGTGARATLYPCSWYGGCYEGSKGTDAGNGGGGKCHDYYGIGYYCTHGNVEIYKCY